MYDNTMYVFVTMTYLSSPVCTCRVCALIITVIIRVTFNICIHILITS